MRLHSFTTQTVKIMKIFNKILKLSYVWSRINGKAKFGFFPVLSGQLFHEERGESGPRPTSVGMKDEETLRQFHQHFMSSFLQIAFHQKNFKNKL